MEKRWIILFVILLFFVIGAYYLETQEEHNVTNTDVIDPDVIDPFSQEAKKDLIRLETPKDGDVIKSPLTIRGEARGNWFFEASFPVILTDWDGKIIAEHYATAQDEWMTTDFVPFEAVLEFEKPSYGERGALILKKDNPSGLPENDDALEITVFYK